MWVLSPRRAAAIASMRPSWPLPRMPMVEPGGSGPRSMPSGIVLRRLWNRRGLLGTQGLEALGEVLVLECQDLRGEQAGISGSGLADGQGPHRHAGRHLHDREQAVLARQRLA